MCFAFDVPGNLRQRRAKTVREIRYDTIRYDTRCYFDVRSKADRSQFNLYTARIRERKFAEFHADM